MVRSALVGDFAVNAFKHILGGTADQIVYNTLKGTVPVSIIAPKALLFDDIGIERDRSTRPKLPVVANPVTQN